jgi:hypothetical protein
LRDGQTTTPQLIGGFVSWTGFQFVGEKVVHSPPKIACHSTGKGWVYWCTSGLKTNMGEST